MNEMIALIFWCSLVGVAYIFAGYPLLITVLGKLRPQQLHREFQPQSVSVVIAIHNEGRTIARKLQSLLSLQHQECLVEILVGCDGSTDDSAAQVRSCTDPRVRVIEFNERRGKPSVLNDLIPQCRGNLVLLTDARQDFDPEFLAASLPNFADDRVGVVSGELVLRASNSRTTAAEGIGLYWKYEKFIRKSESRFRGVPGATGACYMIRKAAFRPIPATAILDDVAIPLSIVAQGYRCLFEAGALAYDDPSQSTGQEAIRKRRTIAGAAQLIRLYPQWVLPGVQPLWFEYLSHKLLRLASPLLLVLILAGNLWLSAAQPYQTLLAIQFAFYVMAGCGWWAQQRGRKSAVFGAPLMFVTLNLTTLAALWDAWRARFQVTWKQAGRVA